MSLSTLAELFDNISQNSKVISFSENIHDLVDSLLHTSFSENGMKLKQVLEEHYRDGIDGFEDVQVDDDIITGIFLDRVSSRLTKKFRFEVTPKNTVYSPINPDDIEAFSELDFADIVKDKKCVKGLSCGASCVPMKNEDGTPTKCNRPNSDNARDLTDSIIDDAKFNIKKEKKQKLITFETDDNRRITVDTTRVQSFDPETLVAYAARQLKTDYVDYDKPRSPKAKDKITDITEIDWQPLIDKARQESDTLKRPARKFAISKREV